MKRLLGMVLALAGVFCLGCNKNNGGPSIEFTRAALESLPLVRSTGTPGTTTLRTSTLTGPITDYLGLAQFFEFQCQHLPDANYCPSSFSPTTDIMDPTRFTMQALIGIIYHAQMYTGTLVTSCTGTNYSPMTVSASSYAAHTTGADSNPTKFIMDNYSLYTCRDSNVADNTAETRVVSAVADGSYQATLHTRYRYIASDYPSPQTDFFQVYASLDAGSPKFLAFNFASAIPYASRVVLLANLTNHTFAAKYFAPAQSGSSSSFYVVAVGTGGYDFSTLAPNAGYYFVHSNDTFGRNVFSDSCVNNADGTIQADTTNCTNNSVPIASTWINSDVIKTYLGVSDADALRIAPYLATFTAPTELGADDAWRGAGDEDLYWPATLQ